MITNALTAAGCIYLTTRAAIQGALDNQRRTREQLNMPVALADSFTGGYTNMAMIAGCLAAPIPSAVLGSMMIIRDVYVHRVQIAAGWNHVKVTYAKHLQKQSATVHTLRAVTP